MRIRDLFLAKAVDVVEEFGDEIGAIVVVILGLAAVVAVFKILDWVGGWSL